MAQKVGAGYVEIEPRVSAKDLKEIQNKIKAFLDGKKFYLDVDVRQSDLMKLRTKINQFLSSRPVYLSVDVRASNLIELRRKISAFLTGRPVYIGVDVSGRQLAMLRAKIRAALSDINVPVAGSGGGGGGDRDRPNLFDDDDDGRSRRRRSARRLLGFGSQASGGFLAGIANAFQLNGPIGGAVILTLAGAIAAAAMPLGAMLGGLIFSALGSLPLIGAVLIGWIENPKVEEAFGKLKDKFKDNVIEPLKGEFGDEIVKVLDQFTVALERWTPLLQSILRGGMSFLQPLANGVESAIDVFLPGFDELINSKFMKSIMERFAGGFEIIAQSFVDAFDEVLKDPEAQAGFVRGVTDFFRLVGFLVEKIFDFLRFTARVWESWNIKDTNGVATVDRFKELFSNIGDIIKVVGEEVFTKENLDNALDGINNVMEFLHAILTNPLVDKLIHVAAGMGGAGSDVNLDNMPGNNIWEELLKNLKETMNPLERFFDPEFRAQFKGVFDALAEDWNSLVASLKRQWEDFKNFWAGAWNWFIEPLVTAWNNAKAEWDRGWAYLSQGWDNFKADIHREWDEFWEPFGTALDKIVQGWDDMIKKLQGIWSNFLGWLRGNAVDSAISKLPTGKATGKGSKRFGGLIHAATGGLLMGPGSGISDSIPLMASDGEFVVNAQATQDNLGLLNAINSGQAFSPNINVYIDGVKTAHRAVVEEAFDNLVSGLVAGRGAS